MNKRWIVRSRQRAKYLFDLIGTERIRLRILQALPFWVASLLTGLVAVVYTRLFGYAETLLKHILSWKDWSIF